MGQEDRTKRRNVFEFLAVWGTDIGLGCHDEAWVL